ncbi:MAG: TetR/AcrR family transcriptional regulator [Gemmatimonadales bacterium]|jgi:AcrR family transcriptional regulator
MAEPAVGRRERKKEETKRRIYVAALELFHEKGFERTTVDEITERADVAKGTFFNYFPHKESVLSYLSEESLRRVEEQAAQRHREASERITALLMAVASAYGENRALTQLVVSAGMQRMFCPEELQSRTRLVSLVKDAIREGQASGEFRSDVPGAVIFLAVGSAFMGTLFWWAGQEHPGEVEVPREEVGLEDLIRSQLQLVFDGVRAVPHARARG